MFFVLITIGEKTMKLLCTTVFALAITTTSFADFSVTYESIDTDKIKMTITYSDHVIGNNNVTWEPEVGYHDAVSDWSSALVETVGTNSLSVATNDGVNIDGDTIAPAFKIKPGNQFSNWYYFTPVPWNGEFGSTFSPQTISLDMGDYGGDITIGSGGGHGLGFYNFSTHDLVLNGSIHYTFVADISYLPKGACCVSSGCASVHKVACNDFGGTWMGETGSCDDCPPTCDADLDGDGEVKVLDLLLLIGAWGICP